MTVIQEVYAYDAAQALIKELAEALQAIAEQPEGVYSRDKEQYLKNVIEWCQNTARLDLAKVPKEMQP